MKKLLYTICFILLSSNVLTQSKKSGAIINGYVSLKDPHLSYIHIGLKGTIVGGLINEKDCHQLENVPEGEYTIMAGGIDYTTHMYMVHYHPEPFILG